MGKDNFHGKFFGTATVGERGQVVIPSEARKKIELSKGEKLLVFGTNENVIAFIKLDEAEKFLEEMSDKLKNAIKVAKKK